MKKQHKFGPIYVWWLGLNFNEGFNDFPSIKFTIMLNLNGFYYMAFNFRGKRYRWYKNRGEYIQHTVINFTK